MQQLFPSLVVDSKTLSPFFPMPPGKPFLQFFPYTFVTCLFFLLLHCFVLLFDGPPSHHHTPFSPLQSSNLFFIISQPKKSPGQDSHSTQKVQFAAPIFPCGISLEIFGCSPIFFFRGRIEEGKRDRFVSTFEVSDDDRHFLAVLIVGVASSGSPVSNAH